MRVTQCAFAAIVAAGAATLAAGPRIQEPSGTQPVFRTGVELLTIDVTALDDRGRQVTDLSPADFAVEVDGDPRQVVSADYVRLVDPRRPVMTAAERRRAGESAGRVRNDPYVSTNAGGPQLGRLVLLIVDRGNIRIGGGRQAAEQARQFVDRLQPEDRIGVALIPTPGEVLDFTTDHDRVKETLLRGFGTAVVPQSRFNLSVTEARALYENSGGGLAVEVLLRECGPNLSALEAQRCRQEVLQDASQIVVDVRKQTDDSVRAIRNLLLALAGIDGSKEIVLLSEGLVLDDLGGSLDDLATAAADARASIDVLLLDAPSVDAAQRLRPNTPREDRALRQEGLEMLASLSRGSLFRVSTSAAFAFDRIVLALDGYFLLAVEAREGDRDGRRHRVSVNTSRPGVSLRTRRSVLSPVSGRAGTAVEAVSRALRSPLPASDLPMRLSTWSVKEPGATRFRVLVQVEADRLADQSLDYVTGLALVDRNNRAFAPEVASHTLASHDPGRAFYATTLVVDPGSYRLRVAMADSEGRIGSVERHVDVFLVDGSAVATGDLLLGPVPSDAGRTFAPAIEPRSAGEPLAAMIEAYLPLDADRRSVEASLEVLRDEQSPAIASFPMPMATTQHADIAAMQAVLDTSVLPAGAYLARASVSYAGKGIGTALRPFRVDRSLASAETPTVPPVLAASMVRALPAFDHKDLFSPAVTTAALGAAAARGTAATDAVKTAQSGDFAAAAMAALLSGDQALGAFLKGLDLLQRGDAARAATQFQVAMSAAPDFVPARVYLGASLATASRHREAAGLLQSGATAAAPALIGRLAGEEWLRAGEFTRAIDLLTHAVARSDGDPHTQKALGLAYVMANRPAEALAALGAYLERRVDDPDVLLAGIYAAYARHAAGAQPTLAADRRLAQTWLKAYQAAGGTLPLPTAWVTYLDALR